MNKIFKKIWCVKRKTFVLTYEKGTAKGKSGFTFSGVRKLTLANFIKIFVNTAMLTLISNALGEGYNPVEVVSGKANIIINDQKNRAVVNQSTQKAIVNWQSFSVPKNGSAIFNQPNSESITLNRVIGKHKTFIDGEINANGQVWILNPNGTLVGKNGSINTHGFMAATHSINNSDFLKGNYKFNLASDNNNMVSNSGKISVGSGYAVLAGKEVNNNGVIVASVGKIVLASSKTFTIDIVGDNLLSFEVNKGLGGENAGISSVGQLKAVDGHILLTAADAEQIVSSVTNAGDMVQANNVKIVGDSIVFTKKTSTSNMGPADFAEQSEIFVEPARDIIEPVGDVVELVNNFVDQTEDPQTATEQQFTGTSSEEEEEEEERHGHVSGEDTEQNPKFDIVFDNSVSPVNQFDSNNPVQVTSPSGSGSNLVETNDQFINQFDPNNTFQGTFQSGSESNLVGTNDQFNDSSFPVQNFDAEIIGANDVPIGAPNEDFTAQPIESEGQLILVEPGGQVISPDGQPLNEQFLEPNDNLQLTPFDPEKDRTEFLAQHGGDKLDPCIVEPILCSNPEFGFQNTGQPFDPNQFFSNDIADNILDPFNQPVEGNIVDFQESPVLGDNSTENNQFDSADFFIAIDRTGLQGDELAGTFEQFGDAERFIETANLASEFGFDVRDVAEFAGKVDQNIFQETFSDVAEVAQKVDGTIIDDLAFVAAREGGSVGEVLESAIEESYDVVRQVSNMAPPGDFAQFSGDFGDVAGGPPVGEFGDPGGDFGGGPTDIVGDPGIDLGLSPGDLGGPPQGDFSPGVGDIGDLAGGPGPGEFLAPAPNDFSSPIPGDLAALPGEFVPPPGLDLGDIGEFGAEAANFGDFTEFGDIGAPPPGDFGSPSPGELGSGPAPKSDLGAPPPGDIIDGGPPSGDVPSPGGDGVPLADGPDGSPTGDGQPPGGDPKSGELTDSPAGDQPPPESAEAPGDDVGPGGVEDAVASDVSDPTPEIASDGPATVDSSPANDSLPVGDAVAGDVSPPSNVSTADALEAPSSAPAPVAVTADVAPPPPPPVKPPPPSPVPIEKAPTPVDSADAGDKTLAAVAPPSPPKPASQPQAVSVKTVPVVPGGVVNVQVPVPPRPPAGLASSPKIPSVGNSSNW